MILMGQFLALRRRPTVLMRLASFALFAVFMGMVGGLGSTFALVVTPRFCFWNRISIFIAFFSLTAAAIGVQALLRRVEASGMSVTVKRRLSWGLCAGILVVGLVDQLPVWIWRGR